MTQWSATWQNKYDFGYYNDSSYNMTITIACMCEACSALAVKYVSVARYSYWVLDHLHALIPHLSDNGRDVHHILLGSLLQNCINSDQCTCPPYTSTERINLSFWIKCLPNNTCMYFQCTYSHHHTLADLQCTSVGPRESFIWTFIRQR